MRWSGAMQLLHPFMPFITETIWRALPHEGPSVMVSGMAGVRRRAALCR